MLIKLLILFAVAAVAPQIFPGVKVKGLSTAALIAVVFAAFNFLLSWLLGPLLTIVTLPAIILTLGLFSLVIPTLVNTVLIKLTDMVLDGFEIKGWWPALGMGLLFGIGVWLGELIVR